MLLALALAVLGGTAFAGGEMLPAPLDTVAFRGTNYAVREVDPKKEDLRLFWKDDQGNPLLDFPALEKAVAAKGEKLLFAANAGMYEEDSTPVGLLVQEGKEATPLNLKDAPGNFYMKPNGVFVINEKHDALVVQSGDYAGLLTAPVWATQSGPMLLLRGDINPEFNADSKNVYIRSGVGVRKDGVIEFAISRKQVTFYEFASFFLNRLKCRNALYLDGGISAFHVAGIKDAMPHTFGPMIGIVEKTP